MPETIKQTHLFRFDQMAVQVKDKVEPEEADVDRYVGLEHIDPESLKIRRWGEPSDVGRAVAALARDAFPFTTGEVFNVDGGFHVRTL